jgi:Lecithin retinol acyltransferase
MHPILLPFAFNFVESFVDNVFRDPVNPAIGSVVYCELALGLAEHSGIYVGNGEIAHLDGSGKLEIVDPYTFINRLGGLNTAMSIYVSTKGLEARGSKAVANRAKKMAGRRRKYSLLSDNCHQFTSGCLTGNFENSDNFLWMLKTTATKTLKTDNWRCWEKIGSDFMITY